MSENLQVTYATLEAAATKSDATAEAFIEQLNALETQIKAVQWQGQSGTAFQAYFDTMKTQLRPVQDTLHQLATQIRGAATNMRDTDLAVSQSFKA